MKVVDTSIWIDFWRGRASAGGLADLLRDGQVLVHPWVTGEIALGNLGAKRRVILEDLGLLPSAPVVAPQELLVFVEHHRLSGIGIGLVDVQVLASTKLAGAQLWTGDRRLQQAWERLGSHG